MFWTDCWCAVWVIGTSLVDLGDCWGGLPGLVCCAIWRLITSCNLCKVCKAVGAIPAKAAAVDVGSDMGVELAPNCGVPAQLDRRELDGELPGDISMSSICES